MEVAVTVCNLSVSSVHSQKILGKIVGSNTKKIRLFCKILRKHHACRSFDHHSELNFFIKLPAFHFQLCHTFLRQFSRFPQLFRRNDHREHNSNMTKRAGTENSPKLCFKHLFHIKGNTNCPPSKERILFFFKVKIGKIFVSANIQCADRQFLWAELCSFTIYLKLFFFCREMIILHIQKLTSKQTDSIDIHRNCSLNILRISHIRAKRNPLSVSCNCRLISEIFQVFLTLFKFLFFLPEFLQSVLIRIQKDHSCFRIHTHLHAVRKPVQNPSDAHQCRNIQAPCDNGYMTGYTAFFGNDSLHIIGIHFYCIRRIKVFCRHDHLSRKVSKIRTFDTL